MPELPIAIGSFEEQKRFIERNAAFFREFPCLNALSKNLFIRALRPPDAAEVERLRQLREDDPAVCAFEDRITADRIIFYLGRMAACAPKCHQPITQEAWTHVRLDVMAKTAEPALAVFYPYFYLEGTAQSHANMFGMERRLLRRYGGITYKETWTCNKARRYPEAVQEWRRILRMDPE